MPNFLPIAQSVHRYEIVLLRTRSTLFSMSSVLKLSHSEQDQYCSVCPLLQNCSTLNKINIVPIPLSQNWPSSCSHFYFVKFNGKWPLMRAKRPQDREVESLLQYHPTDVVLSNTMCEPINCSHFVRLLLTEHEQSSWSPVPHSKIRL